MDLSSDDGGVTSSEDYESDIEDDDPYVLTFTCLCVPHKAILSTGQYIILPAKKRIITIFIRSMSDAIDSGILRFTNVDTIELGSLPTYMDIESSKCVYMRKCLASHVILDSFDTMQIPLENLPGLIIMKDVQQP